MLPLLCKHSPDNSNINNDIKNSHEGSAGVSGCEEGDGRQGGGGQSRVGFANGPQAL